jgi:UDP-GlcNAc:undecaprenyl-phosphate GlcNAc-1-phosphate transferase
VPQKYLSIAEIAGAYWPVLVCSFLVALVATPLCRAYARRHNIVDRPDDRLKPHKRPIPYLGGVAIFAGWGGGLILAMTIFEEDRLDFHSRMVLGILGAGAAATLLGLLDDLRAMSPVKKLVGLSLATAVLITSGVGDDTFRLIFKAIGPQPAMPPWLVLVCSIPITWFIVVGACNATNLIDGMDGLCSGVLAIMAGGFLILAVHMHLYTQWHPLDVKRVVISLAMLGAALGFLPYNRNPATIFMGDAGSMLLGITAAILLLLFAKSSGVRWMMGSVMVFGLPLADMILTIIRRWRHHRPLMQGDRSHFYDQLVDRGWPVRKVVRLSYAIAMIFALAGCSAIVVRVRYLVPLYFLIMIAIVLAVRYWGMISGPEPPKRKSTQDQR